MNVEVEKIQEYLKEKGIVATEDEIIDAATRIATRWGGNGVFACELQKQRGRRGEMK